MHPIGGRARECGERGFSLVEILVVVIIIGVLAAIAIPQFLAQRERAWDAAAQSDLRVVLVFMEVYRSENGQFSVDALSNPATSFSATDDVIVDLSGITDDEYCISASHVGSSNSWEITDRLANVVPGDCGT